MNERFGARTKLPSLRRDTIRVIKNDRTLSGIREIYLPAVLAALVLMWLGVGRVQTRCTYELMHEFACICKAYKPALTDNMDRIFPDR